MSASILASQSAPEDKSHTSPVITPAAVYVNGAKISDLGQTVSLKAGANPTLVRYDHAGRGHFVLRRQEAPELETRSPLAMRWYNDPGVIPFDVYAGDQPPEWFRFLSAPGTSAIRVQAHGTVEVTAHLGREKLGAAAKHLPAPTLLPVTIDTLFAGTIPADVLAGDTHL